MKINVEISCGELLDKLTILEIKSQKITNQKKLENITKEKKQLEEFSELLKKENLESYISFYSELLEVNNKLWNIEDKIRICEKNEDFSSEFIRLARDVYFTNDLRFEIKNNINIFYKSGFVEEKQYVEYKAKK
jgi:hypothetical protein